MHPKSSKEEYPSFESSLQYFSISTADTLHHEDYSHMVFKPASHAESQQQKLSQVLVRSQAQEPKSFLKFVTEAVVLESKFTRREYWRVAVMMRADIKNI